MSHCYENVMKKVKVSDRILLFQHALVLGVYSMLTDKCVVVVLMTLFPTKMLIHLVIHVYGSHTSLTPGES